MVEDPAPLGFDGIGIGDVVASQVFLELADSNLVSIRALFLTCVMNRFVAATLWAVEIVILDEVASQRLPRMAKVVELEAPTGTAMIV